MKIRDQVTNILKASVRARNSDKELHIIYMQLSKMNLTPEQIKIFREMPSLETIRRTRQSIQEQGIYPADPNVEKERRMKSLTMQQNNADDPERLLESQGYKVLPWGQ